MDLENVISSFISDRQEIGPAYAGRRLHQKLAWSFFDKDALMAEALDWEEKGKQELLKILFGYGFVIGISVAAFFANFAAIYLIKLHMYVQMFYCVTLSSTIVLFYRYVVYFREASNAIQQHCENTADLKLQISYLNVETVKYDSSGIGLESKTH